MTSAVQARTPPPMTTSPRDRAKTTAIVIGLDSPTGLQTARILADRGVPVIGIAGNLRHPCCRTRVCREIVITDITGPGLIQSLADIADRLGERPVLFPCTDLSVLMLSRHRAQVEPRFHLLLPAADVIEMLVEVHAMQCTPGFFELLKAALAGFCAPP